MNSNKNTTKVICTMIALLLSSGIALSSAFASGTEAVAQEAVEQTSGEMAKEAAAEVADSAKEKAIAVAKEQANSAVDATLEKVDETLKPAEKAADAIKDTAQ